MKPLILSLFFSCYVYGQKPYYTHGTDIIKNRTNYKVFIIAEINTNDFKKLSFYCKEFKVDTSDQKNFGKQIVTGDTIIINPHSSVKKTWFYMYEKDSLLHDLNLEASVITLKIFANGKQLTSINSAKYYKNGCLQLIITNKMLDYNKGVSNKILSSKPTSILIAEFKDCDSKYIVDLITAEQQYALCKKKDVNSGECLYVITNSGKKILENNSKNIKSICIESPSRLGSLIDYKKYPNVELLIFCGDDFDYEFKEIPPEALQLPKLKAIYLEAVDLDKKIEVQVTKVRPDINIYRSNLGGLDVCSILK